MNVACGRLQPFAGGDLLHSARGPMGGAAGGSPGVGQGWGAPHHGATEAIGLHAGVAGCSRAEDGGRILGAIRCTPALWAEWQGNRRVWVRGGGRHITQPLKSGPRAGGGGCGVRKAAAVCRGRFVVLCQWPCGRSGRGIARCGAPHHGATEARTARGRCWVQPGVRKMAAVCRGRFVVLLPCRRSGRGIAGCGSGAGDVTSHSLVLKLVRVLVGHGATGSGRGIDGCGPG